jgi:ferritin-like metal-binding protein YciE
MQIHSAEDLFCNELCAIYSAEKQLSSVLPDLSKSAHEKAVRQHLQTRQRQGEDLLKHIDGLLTQMNVARDGVRNETVEGMIEDLRTLVQSIDTDAVKDAALIGAVQKIEHYCIAAWGTAAALGRSLNKQPAVQAFETALSEGKQFDKDMTELALKQVNPAACRIH